MFIWYLFHLHTEHGTQCRMRLIVITKSTNIKTKDRMHLIKIHNLVIIDLVVRFVQLKRVLIRLSWYLKYLKQFSKIFLIYFLYLFKILLILLKSQHFVIVNNALYNFLETDHLLQVIIFIVLKFIRLSYLENINYLETKSNEFNFLEI